MILPACTSRIFTKRSVEAVASCSPSELKPTHCTASLLTPSRAAHSRHEGRSNSRTSPDRLGTPPPVASRFPEGLKSSEVTRSAKGKSLLPLAMVCSRVHPPEISQPRGGPEEEHAITLLFPANVTTVSGWA